MTQMRPFIHNINIIEWPGGREEGGYLFAKPINKTVQQNNNLHAEGGLPEKQTLINVGSLITN